MPARAQQVYCCYESRYRRHRVAEPGRLRRRPAGLVDERTHTLGPDQPARDRRGTRPATLHHPDRGLRCQRPAHEHGRHLRLLPHQSPVPHPQSPASSRPGYVRRSPQGRSRAGHPGDRPLRSQQDAQRGLRCEPGLVLQESQRHAGGLQRPLPGLHQRGLLPRQGHRDLERSPSALRRGRPVLQHVRQPIHRLQRQTTGHLPVRQLQAALSRPVRPRPAHLVGCRLPGLHAGVEPQGGRVHRQAGEEPPAERRAGGHRGGN